MQLRENKIPKGLVPLEKLFDRDHRARRHQEERKQDDFIEVHIGTKLHPNIIHIGNNCSTDERREIEALIQEYKDIFASSYDDLEVYEEDIIKYTIPLKEGAKPLGQK
jgi:hypothetical protein